MTSCALALTRTTKSHVPYMCTSEPDLLTTRTKGSFVCCISLIVKESIDHRVRVTVLARTEPGMRDICVHAAKNRLIDKKNSYLQP